MNVVVVRAGEEPPDSWVASLFLAGQAAGAVEIVRRRWCGPGALVVFVPGGSPEWETHWRDRADQVVCWAPDECGRWPDDGRVVPGTATIEEAVDVALARLGDGAARAGGERHVPLHVWRTPSFQGWLARQVAEGNELVSGRLEWTFRVGAERERVFLWAFHAQVRVGAEDRVKTNEVVLARPDITSVVAYRRAAEVTDTEVVLVREYRTPGGFVLELPGGSSWGDQPPREVAALELGEETGLSIEPDRLRAHHARPLAATFSAHRQHLFSVELTADELAAVRAVTGPLGELGSSERTYPRVARFGALLTGGEVDWTTLGGLSEVLLGGSPPP